MGGLALDVLVVLAGMAAGLLRGGRLAGLRQARVVALPLGVACLLAQALCPLVRPRALGPLLLALALVALLLVARANARLPGVPLLALGALAGLLVVTLNLGMPVTAATLDRAGLRTGPRPGQPAAHRPDGEHVLQGRGTRLALLADRFAVRPLRTVVSFGDAAELAGLFVLVQQLTLLAASPARRRSPARGAHEASAGPWSTWAD